MLLSVGGRLVSHFRAVEAAVAAYRPAGAQDAQPSDNHPAGLPTCQSSKDLSEALSEGTIVQVGLRSPLLALGHSVECISTSASAFWHSSRPAGAGQSAFKSTWASWHGKHARRLLAQHLSMASASCRAPLEERHRQRAAARATAQPPRGSAPCMEHSLIFPAPRRTQTLSS
jgi:hypothetical protein